MGRSGRGIFAELEAAESTPVDSDSLGPKLDQLLGSSPRRVLVTARPGGRVADAVSTTLAHGGSGGSARTFCVDLERACTTPEALWLGVRNELLGRAGLLDRFRGKRGDAEFKRRWTAEVPPPPEQLGEDIARLLSRLGDLDQDAPIVVLHHLERLGILPHFPGLKGVLERLGSAIAGSGSIRLVATSEHPAAALGLFDEPLSDGWSWLRYAGWSTRRIRHEVEERLGRDDPELTREVADLAQGTPLIAVALLRRIQEDPSLDAKEALQAELLEDSGRLNLHCHRILETGIHSARGQGVLEAVLRAVAASPGSRLTPIAHQVGRSAPATKDYLVSLGQVDLVRREGKEYFVADPLLARWLVSRFDLDVDPTTLGEPAARPTRTSPMKPKVRRKTPRAAESPAEGQPSPAPSPRFSVEFD